jgi:translocon-associated protein subunit alpha
LAQRKLFAEMLGKFILILVCLLPVVIQIAGPGGSQAGLVRAEDDILTDGGDADEELDGTVENDEVAVEDEGAAETETAAVETEPEKEEEEEADKSLKPSPDAETHILFTRPTTTTDFPAGHTVRFLVGFSNKGSQDFIVESMDAAFRYPQDYSFYIQNFTTYRYYRTVEPNREATFEYAFTPSESFSARSFGLTVNLNYHDSDGNLFQDAVFNATINVTEPDEGLDGETFFLYVFLFAIIVLLIVGAHQLLTSFGKKRLLKSKSSNQPIVEMGTQNNRTDVDFDWLPKETLQEMNKPGGRSPKVKTSPRQRNSKRRTGGVDD